jgi:hypothetical protein
VWRGCVSPQGVKLVTTTSMVLVSLYRFGIRLGPSFPRTLNICFRSFVLFVSFGICIVIRVDVFSQHPIARPGPTPCIYSLFSSIISPPISLLLHIPNLLPPHLGVRSGRSPSRHGLLRNKVPTSPTSNKPHCHSVILLNGSSLSSCKSISSGGDRVDGLSNEWGCVISESEEVC